MSKSSGSRLFGSGSGDRGAVTVVEVSVARSAARRARIAFWIFALGGIGGGALVALFDRGHGFVDVMVGLVVGAGSGLVAGAVVRVWPVLRLVWYWALELVVAGGLVAGVSALGSAVSPVFALLVLLAVVAAAGLFGPSRRWLVMVAWCVIVRHRLRMCFAEFIRTPTRTSVGSLPLILIARPTPAGERVWLWLRPGLDLSDLEGRLGKLAVACWANEVRIVQASSRFAALLRVDVARRDPLVDRIDSPLTALVPNDFTSGAWTSAVDAPAALNLADVPDLVDVKPTTAAAPSRESRAPARGRLVPPPGLSSSEYDAFI